MPEVMQVFSKNSGNAENYRIPALIVTKHGTLVACADERFFTAGDNPNRIDKVVRRSLDNGATWGEQIVMVKEVGESKAKSSAAIDPALLYDEETDTIFCLYCHTPAGIGILNSTLGLGDTKYGKLIKRGSANYYMQADGSLLDSAKKATPYTVDGDGFVIEAEKKLCNIYAGDGEFKEFRTSYLMITASHDDGLTWSKPFCLDKMTKSPYMGFIGPGPGVGIQIKNGKYKGRLVFPIYFNVIKFPLMMSNAVIYSDDHGATWKRGKCPNDGREIGLGIKMSHRFVLPRHMVSESQVIELPDGTLKIFMRNHHPKHLIATATSADGGESWANFSFHPQLIHSVCQCSVINVMHGDKPATLFINAADSKKRINGTVRLSYDFGATFPHSKLIKEGEFVYSSMVQMPNGEIGVLFEGSTQHETVDFMSFPIEFILE